MVKIDTSALPPIPGILRTNKRGQKIMCGVQTCGSGIGDIVDGAFVAKNNGKVFETWPDTRQCPRCHRRASLTHLINPT